MCCAERIHKNVSLFYFVTQTSLDNVVKSSFFQICNDRRCQAERIWEYWRCGTWLRNNTTWNINCFPHCCFWNVLHSFVVCFERILDFYNLPLILTSQLASNEQDVLYWKIQVCWIICYKFWKKLDVFSRSPFSTNRGVFCVGAMWNFGGRAIYQLELKYILIYFNTTALEIPQQVQHENKVMHTRQTSMNILIYTTMY